ncbi:MAG: hypothetical protein JXA93_18895 [Anaerolineae bacterium]|nr:hypothetical protein [Anaerolineae bacterium]
MEIQTGIRFKHIVLLMAIAFAVTLAVMVAKQMSSEAMAVVIGVVCGVLAAVPTTVLLMLILVRSDRLGQDAGRGHQQKHSGASAYPPVVVIQGGTPQTPVLPPGMAGYWPGATMGTVDARDFRVVGGDDLLEDGRYER